jgi:hypothetical protein
MGLCRAQVQWILNVRILQSIDVAKPLPACFFDVDRYQTSCCIETGGAKPAMWA